MQNPYMNKKMLPHDSDMFFGREREIKNIESYLISSDQPQCVSIVGERRIGKSSVANRVYHKFKKSKNTIAVFLDCGGLPEDCTKKDDFFRILNKKFLEISKERQDLKEHLSGYGENLFRDYPSFSDFIKEEAKKGLKFIIFIDEFEHLPEKDFADRTFFSNLRAMAYSPDNRLAFVTISRKNLKDLTPESIQTSEFWNIFTTKTIGLLDDVSIRKLRTKGFKKLQEEDVKKIHYYAGNFPFFNQIACNHIFDAELQGTDFNENSLKSDPDLISSYKTLWEHRTDREKKVILNTLKGKKNLEGFSSEINDMLARGILKKERDILSLFSGFFLDFICDTVKGYSIVHVPEEGPVPQEKNNKATVISFIVFTVVLFILFYFYEKDAESFMISVFSGILANIVCRIFKI